MARVISGCAASALVIAMMSGCKSAAHQATLSTLPKDAKVSVVSIRPTVPPPSFKLFHQTADSITLVTKDNATDDEIEAVLWQLHDAAHTHTFDTIHIPQTFMDKRDPIVFIHIYRGTKCAAEKYATGNPPCGGSYHAAGDYTIGSFKNPNRDDGVLLHDENHQVELWDPDQAQTIPQQGAKQ